MTCECGNPIPPSKPKGGPRKFCSSSCMRRSLARARRARPDYRAREQAQSRTRYAADPKRAMARTLAWRDRNPVDAKLAAKKSRLKKDYGLTPEQYDAFVANAGSCPICHRVFTDVRPVLDHDHKTGAVRGVLCSSCNAALGLFEDDWERMHCAVQYLFGERSNLREVSS